MAEDQHTPLYPAFLDLSHRLAVIIGGGVVAQHTVMHLLRYGADILVVSPQVEPGIDALVADGIVEHEPRGYIRGDLGGAFLVVCTSSELETARAVYQEAETLSCLVQVVGHPELSNFMVPEVAQRGPLQVAVSSGGAAPALDNRLRKRFAKDLGPEWAVYVTLLGEVREMIEQRVSGSAEERAELCASMIDSDLFDRIVLGRVPTAEEVFHEFVFGDSGVRPDEVSEV